MKFQPNLQLSWALLFLFAAGCGRGSDDSKAGHAGPIRVQSTYQGAYPIQVVCTTGMVADLVENVAGPHAKVQQLMGEGIDPHRYKPPIDDIRALQAADLIFYSGRNLEGKMGDIFVRMAGQGKPTFAVTQYIDDDLILEDEDEHWDPHLWFDVALWSKAVGVVRDVLLQYDPRHASEYRRNAEAYQAKLTQLDEWVRKEIATILPKEQRVLVTSHDAFRYFGKAYDIEVKGIQGISTEDEASVKKINELVQFIANRKIKTIFPETSVPEGNIKSLQEGCERGRGHKVIIGDKLFSDAMGAPGTEKGTYEGMIRHNVNTIVKALK
jgi:manganese/zinc/iron transport system substrate-binding protein